MSERKDERWCVSPMMTCPNCDEFGDNIYHDNEEENEWGYFRDAHCLNCGYWWCEIVEEDEDD